MGDDFQDLVRDLTALFARGVGQPLGDDAFDGWARRVFQYQVETNPVYGRFAEGRGRTPGTVTHWTEIPAVPTTAFKHFRLLSADPARVERTFLTSGTSRGAASRGQHAVPSFGLYRASLVPNFAAHLLPDGARLPLVSLVPHPREAPESSLSAMVGVVEEDLAAPGGGWFVDPEGGLDAEGLVACLEALATEGHPVLLVGTAFAFVHWLDALVAEGRRVRLAEGSRIMETGGFKGRSRSVPRRELYGAMSDRTGVDPRRIVNEYGMTELLSQFYEPVLATPAPPGAGDGRRHLAPPWVRTRVLDPRTLDAVPEGEPGILCHLDLANAGSVAAVLTEDRGVQVGDGFLVLGRQEGAEPRGCSLALDELLAGSRA
ncbi:MAG TPA: hypothetical protein VGA70_09080 [Longimicrobiales bacterium]